ncbi:MAG: phosphotransferase family protein [Pseudomonadota bacterium]
MAQEARQRTLDTDNLTALEAFLADALSASQVAVGGATLLGGGAIQENWRLDVDVADGPRAGSQTWVMRTDAAAVLSLSLDRASEYAVLQAAHSAGARAAEPIARCEDRDVVGAPFLVQGFAEGTAQARKIVRDPDLATWGGALAGDLAQQLARVHGVRPSSANISALPVPIGNPAQQEVAKFRGALDGSPEPRPALEYVLCWLNENAPFFKGELALIHGDFRTGNYLVDGGRLTAILDWEFSHWGDPDEDIGWFCANCWRFGNAHLPAGGIATYSEFISAYEQAAERKLDPLKLRYWEIMAAAKWATIAHLQGDRYRKSGELSVELALTGMMVTELELEAFDGIKAYEAGKGVY